MGCSLTKNAVGVHNTVTTATKKSANLMEARFSGLKLIIFRLALLDCFISYLCDEEQAALGVRRTVSKLNRGMKSPSSQSQLNLRFLDSISDHETLSLSNSVVKACQRKIASLPPQSSSNVASALLANMQHPKLIIVICLNLYPEFLKSSSYIEWSRQESAKNHTHCPQQDLLVEEVSTSFYSVEHSQVFKRALSNIDANEIEHLLGFGNWFAYLLLAVEELSISISIATARPDRPGFPLVYVNSAFETLTGYERREIVGRNCRILQGEKAEADAINRLGNALRDATPVCVTVTNFRKDGIPFRNLLKMKPVFDELGNYRYVFAVQLDVTNEEITPEKFKLVDEVLKILPNVVVYRHNTHVED